MLSFVFTKFETVGRTRQRNFPKSVLVMRFVAAKVFLTHAFLSTRSVSSFSTINAMSTTDVKSFIDSTNADYETLHREFELQFWGTKMNLSDPKFSTAEARKQIIMRDRLRISKPVFQKADFLGDDFSLSAVDETDAFSDEEHEVGWSRNHLCESGFIPLFVLWIYLDYNILHRRDSTFPYLSRHQTTL